MSFLPQGKPSDMGVEASAPELSRLELGRCVRQGEMQSLGPSTWGSPSSPLTGSRRKCESSAARATNLLQETK